MHKNLSRAHETASRGPSWERETISCSRHLVPTGRFSRARIKFLCMSLRGLRAPPSLPRVMGVIVCVCMFVYLHFLVHGQVTIIFVVSVGLSVCLFVQSFSQPSLIRFRSN